MKAISKELSRKLKRIEIVPLADLHIGDPLCDMTLVKSKIDYIKDNEEVYCVLNGDILNNSIKTSVGDVYGEELTPMRQLKRAVELLEPIKKKILCVTSGNHEARTYKTDGIDITYMLCVELGISDVYVNEGALLFLRFGEYGRRWLESKGSGSNRMICYTIYLTHGSGGGRKEGSKAVRLADMASIVDADIYIHSHTHLPMIMKQAFYRTDTRNSAVSVVDKLFINTSAMLNYGGYGQVYEFKPNSKDTPHIYLNGTKKEFIAKL